MDNVTVLDNVSCTQFALPDYGVELVVPMTTLAGLFVENYESVEAAIVHLMYGKDPDDVVLEAGGGVGFISLLIAQSGIRRLVTFEPQPFYNKVLIHNLELNNAEGVEVRRAALGVGKSTAEFSVRYLPYASALEGIPSHDYVRETIEVEVVDVGEEIQEYGANALHLDVEGSEAEILMAIDLAPIRKVVVEMHSHVLGASVCTLIIKRLSDAGLEPCLLGNSPAYPNKCYALGFARHDIAERIRGAGGYGPIQVITGWEFHEGGEDVASTAVD